MIGYPAFEVANESLYCNNNFFFILALKVIISIIIYNMVN